MQGDQSVQRRPKEVRERRGIAMISNAQLRDGRSSLRACITNFRTSAQDVEAIVKASAEIAAELAGSSGRV